MRNSDEEDGDVSWAGLLLVVAGTFLADVGYLAMEFVARDDAQDSATIGRTVLMQDILENSTDRASLLIGNGRHPGPWR